MCRPPDNREFTKPIQSPVTTQNGDSPQIPHLRRSTQTAIHLPESVELLEKKGAWRRRSGMIVKTVEIVEERRTGQASQPRLNHASLEREAGAARRRRGIGSTMSGSGAHSERKMDGGRNRIVTRHERWGGLIGCSKWRRVREGNPRFRTYYRAGQPPRFAR